MSLSDSPRAAFPTPSAPRAHLARHRKLRPARLRLNLELVRRLTPEVIREGARRLGMLRGNDIFFESEDESAVLMDYCVYNVYREGRNAVEQYLCDCPPGADSEAMICLRTMVQATYTLLVVMRAERGVGCQVRNLFAEEDRLLVDIGFSRTVEPGAVMATRLLDFGDFVATGGAALPAGFLDVHALDRWQRQIRTGGYEQGSDPASLIRNCLEDDRSLLPGRDGVFPGEFRSDGGGTP